MKGTASFSLVTRFIYTEKERERERERGEGRERERKRSIILFYES